MSKLRTCAQSVFKEPLQMRCHGKNGKINDSWLTLSAVLINLVITSKD